jgi:hypothetical protein
MDEEFQALVEYVKHRLFSKASMALDATWKEKKPKKVEEYVKEKMQDWEALVAPHLECITWGWHLMFQIFTPIPLLQGVLPQSPWMHSKEEALKVALAICNMQMLSLLRPTPWIVLIIKMFMFAKGFREPLSHPIKGGIRHNILEWIGLGFTSRAWSPIKQMLQEEGFLLCVGCTNVFSYQEWK